LEIVLGEMSDGNLIEPMGCRYRSPRARGILALENNRLCDTGPVSRMSF
jgi:hypothetical protein